MSVIALASPKGGVGKTTTALLLGTTLARRSLNVALLDCDPNQPLTAWAEGGQPSPTIIGNVRSDTVLSHVDREATRRDMVLIDLEGSASRLVGYAMARSDLVLVPMGASSLDAAQAARAVALVRQEEQLLRREIPCRVLFTRTGAIPTKAERALKRDLKAGGVGVLGTQVGLRVAYESMFFERVPVHDLDPEKVAGLPAAIANAETLADEIQMVLAKLKGRVAA